MARGSVDRLSDHPHHGACRLRGDPVLRIRVGHGADARLRAVLSAARSHRCNRGRAPGQQPVQARPGGPCRRLIGGAAIWCTGRHRRPGRRRCAARLCRPRCGSGVRAVRSRLRGDPAEANHRSADRRVRCAGFPAQVPAARGASFPDSSAGFRATRARFDPRSSSTRASTKLSSSRPGSLQQ